MSEYWDHGDIKSSEACENHKLDDNDECQECIRVQAEEGAYWKAYFGGSAGIRAKAAQEKFEREEYNGRTFEELSREEQHEVNRQQKGR